MLPHEYYKYTYGNYNKLSCNPSSPVVYSYDIYFYTGNLVKQVTLDNGTVVEVPASVGNIKEFNSSGVYSGTKLDLTEDDSTTKWKLDGEKVTMAQYAEHIHLEIANQLNPLLSGLGLSFSPLSGAASYQKYTTDKFADYKTLGDNEGVILVFNPYLNEANSCSYPTDYSGKNKFFLKSLLLRYSFFEGKGSDYASYGTVFGQTGNAYNIRNVILHEMTHALGFAHPFAPGYTFSSTYKTYFVFGNYDIRSSPIYQGFIHKGMIPEDYVNGIDVVYNKSSGVYTLTFTLSSSDSALLSKFKDGLASAYLFDGNIKEAMHQSPVDSNGVCKFKLRILPPSTIDYYLLIVSAEYLTHCVWSEKKQGKTLKLPLVRNSDNTFTISQTSETDSNGKEFYTLSDTGKIWYNLTNIGSITGDMTQTITLREENTTESFEAFDNVIENLKIDYGSKDDGDVVIVGRKVYRAKVSHKSTAGDNGNKPGVGKKWKSYWSKLKRYDGDQEEWRSGKTYNGMYKSKSSEQYINPLYNCKL